MTGAPSQGPTRPPDRYEAGQPAAARNEELTYSTSWSGVHLSGVYLPSVPKLNTESGGNKNTPGTAKLTLTSEHLPSYFKPESLWISNCPFLSLSDATIARTSTNPSLRAEVQTALAVSSRSDFLKTLHHAFRNCLSNPRLRSALLFAGVGGASYLAFTLTKNGLPALNTLPEYIGLFARYAASSLLGGLAFIAALASYSFGKQSRWHKPTSTQGSLGKLKPGLFNWLSSRSQSKEALQKIAKDVERGALSPSSPLVPGGFLLNRSPDRCAVSILALRAREIAQIMQKQKSGLFAREIWDLNSSHIDRLNLAEGQLNPEILRRALYQILDTTRQQLVVKTHGLNAYEGDAGIARASEDFLVVGSLLLRHPESNRTRSNFYAAHTLGFAMVLGHLADSTTQLNAQELLSELFERKDIDPKHARHFLYYFRESGAIEDELLKKLSQ